MRDPAPADHASGCPDDALPATGERLRETLRAVASPVVVVTALAAGAPRGATIGSFVSLSLAPPTVAFSVTQGTRFHDALADADRVAIHLLAAHQHDVASRFAVPDLDGEAQLDGLTHRRAAGRPAVLSGTLGVLHGRIAERIALADHTLTVVRVERIEQGVDAPPLLWYRQGYRAVGESLGDALGAASSPSGGGSASGTP